MTVEPASEAWSNQYLGLPFQTRGATRDGVSCWGLVKIVYSEQLGIDVPDYDGIAVDLADRAEVAGIYESGTACRPWVSVDRSDMRPFDILVFRVGGLDAHVGMYVCKGRMLHATGGQISGLVGYETGRWAPRLSGIYRHESVGLEDN